MLFSIPNLPAVLLVAAVITLFCWQLSQITHDYSWVDRSWSISPVLYGWIFFAGSLSNGGGLNLRALIMALLITIWGMRLTFNFARKGGYTGVEDYRWSELRQSMKKPAWQLFNIFFIDIYQNLLLVLITVPVGLAAGHNSSLTPWDALLMLLFLLATFGEYKADQQMWNYQTQKHAALDAGKSMLGHGFIENGLFKYSRHPNYFFEQSQWWLIYLIAAIDMLQDNSNLPGFLHGFINPTIIGAALLTLLFIGSTIMTEAISKRKYPEYTNYQNRTSAQIPWWPRRK